MSASATPEPVIRQIVDAMRTLAGPHPGFRPVHAKGLVCSGTFRASADADWVRAHDISTDELRPVITQTGALFGADGLVRPVVERTVDGWIKRCAVASALFSRARINPASRTQSAAEALYSPTL
jgi:hypothetical protein